jgi:hypothetical protein
VNNYVSINLSINMILKFICVNYSFVTAHILYLITITPLHFNKSQYFSAETISLT